MFGDRVRRKGRRHAAGSDGARRRGAAADVDRSPIQVGALRSGRHLDCLPRPGRAEPGHRRGDETRRKRAAGAGLHSDSADVGRVVS